MRWGKGGSNRSIFLVDGFVYEIVNDLLYGSMAVFTGFKFQMSGIHDTINTINFQIFFSTFCLKRPLKQSLKLDFKKFLFRSKTTRLRIE